jgi:hypothetical protein
MAGWNHFGDSRRKSYTMDGLQFAPAKKQGMASIVALLIVFLGSVASHADEPKDDHAAPPKSQSSPPGKEPTANPPKKPAPASAGVDTDIVEVPANTQSNRLKRMHGIIELHLKKDERKVFEQNEINYPIGYELEQFYKSVCADLEITC